MYIVVSYFFAAEHLFFQIASIKLEELQQHCKNNEKAIIAQIIASVESVRPCLQNEPGVDIEH